VNLGKESAVIPDIDRSLAAGQLATLPVWLLVVLGVIALAEIALDVIALVDLYRRPVAQVTFGNKWVWVILIILINLIGSILYLAIGRHRPPQADAGAQPTGRRADPASVADALYGPRDDTKEQ
jgi:hypothetical protein